MNMTRTKNWKRFLSFVVSGMMAVTCISFPKNNEPTSVYAAEPNIESFSLSDVKMTDAYTVNAFSKEIKYLLSFDTGKLLAGYRENAGLPTNGATRYGGWESSLIAGHTVGHYLTAIAQAYANPLSTSEQKDALYKKAKDLIDGLKVCQQNSKGKPGFLWAAKNKNPSNVEEQFDNVENGKTNIINESWVPWYTMHKLIAGIVDVYNLMGYEPAKDVGSSLGDWCYNRASKWSDQTHNKVLSVEYGGLNDCLYELYLITGKDNHAVAAHYFDETALYEKILKGGTDVLNGRHANTTIPKFIGCLKRYIAADGKTINGQKVDASKYLQYAEAFWDMVATHHTYITGGNSEWEHFGKDDVLDAERTNCNCETCNSYNMLKLSRELFKITGDKKYMDYYENTYYNSILSSQNPETGMTTYFQPMATGYFKVYSSEFNSFWCCTGSGMESMTKLGDTIYMHKGNTLYVNCYQSSVVNWADKNVKVTQESTIPNGNTTKFTIDGSGSLEFRFRIPDWAADNVTITVNGTKYTYKTENDYAIVSGDFSSGDSIELTIPLAVKAYALPDNPSSYAFKYGPVVLSAELGTSNMKQGTTGMNVSIPADAVTPTKTINLKDSSGTLSTYMYKINDYMKKDANSLKFTLTGADTSLTFTPHYLQYKQRYGIYWIFKASGNAVEEEIPRSKETVIDTVQPGYGQYENDELHAMDEQNSVSVTDDSTYRYATKGGHFKYQMAVDKDAAYTLLQVTFRKADNGKPIVITAGDRILFQGKLDYSGSEDVYNVSYIIPDYVLNDCVKNIDANGTTYDVIDIGFSSGSTADSARVCDFIYTKTVKPDYQIDSSIAYFVDCGDHNTRTASNGDKYGYYNSLTEQLYGPDQVTGMKWGLVDDPSDQYGGSKNSKGLYTANTWCDERNTQDGRAKTASFRYTKNQYENNIDRHLDYRFDLPNGKYSVEMCFSNPWSCSTSPTVYQVDGSGKKTAVAENCATDSRTASKGNVTVTDGTLNLSITSADKAINVNYIIIRAVDVEKLPEAEAFAVKGDVNADGSCTTADLVALRSFMLGAKTTLEDASAADFDSDGKITIIDFCLLKQTLMK